MEAATAPTHHKLVTVELTLTDEHGAEKTEEKK